MIFVIVKCNYKCNYIHLGLFQKKIPRGGEGKRYMFLWVVGADIFQIIWVIGV